MTGPYLSGNLVGPRYRIERFAGQGGMQFVYEAKDQLLDRLVALKTPKNASAEKRFHRSAIVAAKVNHPNVAKTLDYFEIDGRAHLIEEFIVGKDLQEALLKQVKAIDPYLAARIFHYLARALSASHRAGVVHRDLKPQNVMISGEFKLDALKITDFGIAKMAEAELIDAAEGGEQTIIDSATAVGALPYMAPEAIDTPRQVTTAADIWSAGAMMFELLAGQRPFGSGLRAVAKIMEAKVPAFPPLLHSNPQFSPLSKSLIELITQCLKKNPSERPTADELVEQCGNLCYPTSARIIGSVKSIRYNAWGFIDALGEGVFFHFSSVYGERPGVGSKVAFSKFSGGNANRAHPVITLKP